MQRKRLRNPRNRKADIPRRHMFEQPFPEHKALRAAAERNLLQHFPSLEGTRVLRAISNFGTTPHLNEIERGRALLGAYQEAFDVVKMAAEKALVATRMGEIAQQLNIAIRTHSGYGQRGNQTLEEMGVRTRRRNPR